MSLDKFKEPIEIAGEVVDKKYTAYKMDSTVEGNMRSTAGLGMCDCFDYFLLENESIIFIEETQLSAKAQEYKEKYADLKEMDKIKLANELIKNEIKVKTYGTITVLSRLSIICAYVKELMENKKHQFWIVASVKEGVPIDEKYLDNQSDILTEELAGAIGGSLHGVVKIKLADEFVTWLSNHATMP